MIIIEIIFWLSILLIFYSYLFYPLILKVLAVRKQANSVVYTRDDELPVVSVIISAFNEEDVIEEKINTIFQNSYPEDKFEVLVGSDFSTDSTNEIVQKLAGKYASLKFYPFTERRGKQNVVNDLVKDSRGSILVLTDANVMFDEETLFMLVRNFKNKKIGLVDTNMQNVGLKKEGISIQESQYISREVFIKNMEGRLWGAMMGPFGGCYAIRKEDYEMVPSNYLVDDFYINMKIFEKRKLAINDLDSKVFEDVSNNITDELRRKVRIATGNFQNLKTFSFLLFRKHIGFCFFSHKVLRWFGPFLIILAFISNVILAFMHPYYCYILIGQLLVSLLPLADRILKSSGVHNKYLRLITHFYAMNLALFLGFFRFLKPVKSGVWDRTKRNQ